MCHNWGSPAFLAMIRYCLHGDTSKCVMGPPGTVMHRIWDGSGTGNHPVSGTNCKKNIKVIWWTCIHINKNTFVWVSSKTMKKTYQWNRVAITPSSRWLNCDAQKGVLTLVSRNRSQPWNQLSSEHEKEKEKWSKLFNIIESMMNFRRRKLVGEDTPGCLMIERKYWMLERWRRVR